eukprot:TRINITY_DN6240_c0_g1_i1.p1 TRINITY_DN6240_c0_g1~~TRINITY_DN6240_c0_g1_i1.p1  ORF type:complete len:281 (-),score=39.73 TRINITY_DN6240_c0_g1_i1:67-909(-)
MSRPILVYGASGYLGSELVSILSKMKEPYVIGKSRIENFEQVKREITDINPVSVICTAGLKGKPNVDWFEVEENKPFAKLINVDSQVQLAKLCSEHNIHCTLLGTGFVYNYDDNHPIGEPIGFKEDDKPNWDKLHYVKLKIMLEEEIQKMDNVLHLRINLPISSNFHPASFLAKIITMKNVVSSPTSFTVVDDLWPVMVDMSKKKIVGNFNFTNPGCISHDDILKLYQKHVDPNHSWNLAESNGSRPNCLLNTDKLLSYYPDVKNIRLSIEQILIQKKLT